jgi:segregation and condensation protein B
MDIRRNTPLSQAAMEVLAIIAYNQPVTRPFVEQVRGVDCSAVVQGLQQKGLIEEKGRMDLPGRPLLYGTTSNFLRCFGISSLDQLPPLPQKEDNTMRETTLDEVLMEQQPTTDEVFGPEEEYEDVVTDGQEE